MKEFETIMTISNLIVPAKPTTEQKNTCPYVPTEHISAPGLRHDVAFFSLAELRREVHVNIALTVAHIRELIALEDAR